MSSLVDTSSRPDDVGQLLVGVQDDLQQLKSKLLSQVNLAQSSHIDLTYLENAIQKTEKSIKSKTEQALNQFNNRVTTMPDVDNQSPSSSTVLIETLWDIKSSQKAGQQQLEAWKNREEERKLVAPDGTQIIGLSPGQQAIQTYNAKIIRNPYNTRNREVVKNAYKIQLPLINERKSNKSYNESKVLKGTTCVQLARLPRPNGHETQIVPSAVTEDDLQRGIVSLIDRDFIPRGSQLHLVLAPISMSIATIHSGIDKQPKAICFTESQEKLAVVRYDSASRKASPPTPAEARPMSVGFRQNDSSRIKRRHTYSTKSVKAPVPVRLLEMQIHPQPPPTTPNSNIFEVRAERQSHRFAIQNGKLKETAEDYLAFKQHYCLSWGGIATMLKHLTNMLSLYSVPVAFINGDKLVDLSLRFELEQVPSNRELLCVIVNQDDVLSLINAPGRRFRSSKGKELAATKIQATYRMYKKRSWYLDYRRKKWAAGVLAISWIMCLKLCKVKRQLKVKRQNQVESFRVKSKQLSERWDRMKSSKRVVIHIPSLGYSHGLRQTAGQFDLQQNFQMSRLCDLKDDKTDVIYVSSVAISDELAQYYSKLMGLQPAVASGNVDDQQDLAPRYQIIVPEAIKSFQNRNMCLSSLLKYSPRSLKRIKNLIKGREAYIVTGKPHMDDLYVADYLDVPILGPEPDVAQLYSTKSGSKRIFHGANVQMPPSEYDVYSLQQMYESLSQLIIDNPDISRWLLKIDEEFDGRGIACVNVAQNLPSYAWIQKEAERYGDKWTKKWAQETAFLRILNEMPNFMAEFAEPLNKKVYPTWEIYLKSFLSQGGIIEACPPSDSITALTVNMLIEPNGAITMVSNGDQIHAETEFTCWGLSTPQSSIEPAVLNESCFKIADACKARGVVGYFTIDFVTFIDPKSMNQKLWATDLDLAYSDSLAMHQLVEFVSGGKLDPVCHIFNISSAVVDEKKKRRRVTVSEPEQSKSAAQPRYAVLSTRLYHSNLAMVHYSIFFQMCRAHGIGYDILEKHGTVFTIVDSTRRESLGMVCVGDSLQTVLATFARNLSVIHQEISSPNLQGVTNFKAAIQDIEGILGITEQNSERQSPVEKRISSASQKKR